MTKTMRHLLAISLLLGPACFLRADQHALTLLKTKEETAQLALKKAKALERYAESRGIELVCNPALAASKLQNELLPELLPRQVNELGLRLRIRNALKFNEEKPVNNILFHGPPGLGKTEAAAKVAKDGGFHFVSLPATGLVNKFQNSGAEKFQEAIDAALAHYTKTGEESFIFMDEFDAIGRDVKDTDATMVINRQTEQAALMHIWQTILTYRNDKRLVFCFGTNKMKSLHKTFISRFMEEHIIEFKLPDAAQRTIAFEHYLKAYDFLLTKELNISPAAAQQTLSMLVKASDGMNYRAIRDAVRSFKGQKSLSALTNDDLIHVAKYLKENHEPEIVALKTKLAATHDNKIDAAIIAIHEKLTGKEATQKASTNKELYEIVQRTKAKDGYDWSEQFKQLNEKLSKNVDPWLHRTQIYYAVATGVAYAGYHFLVKPYINPKNDPNLEQLINRGIALQLARLGIGAAGAAAVAAQAGSAANNNAIQPGNGFCGPYG